MRCLTRLAITACISLPGLCTAQTAQRLAAQSVYMIKSNGTRSLHDSTTYYYSHGRGSNIQVPMPNDYSLSTDLFEYVAVLKGHPYKDIKFDSSVRIYGSYSRKTENIYDASGKVMETLYYYLYGSIGGLEGHDLFTYNSAGDNTQYLDQAWDANSLQWLDNSRTFSHYNAGHLPDSGYTQVKMQNGNWLNQYKYLYDWTGNSLNLLLNYKWDSSAGIWQIPGRSQWYYHGPMPDSVILHDTMGNGGYYHSIRRYKYDSNGNLYLMTRNSIVETYITDSSVFDNAGNRILTFETFSPYYLLLSDVNYNSRTTITYTSSNQPLLETVASYDSSSQSYRDTVQYIYYYETYTPAGTASVNDAPDIRLFPNPASASLNLQINSRSPLTAMVMISDAAGKIVKMFSFCDIQHYSEALDIATLSAGNYQLSVCRGSKVWTKPFTVIK